MGVLRRLFGWLVALLKFRMVFIEAVCCSLAALLAWSFVLGADPRRGQENRHLAVIIAAMLYGCIVGVALFFSGRFRPSPWLFVRAAQLAAGIALVQLAAVQNNFLLKTAIAVAAFIVLASGLLASLRVIFNRAPHRGLDVLLVYGTLGLALLVAGGYQARRLNLDVTFHNGGNRAKLRIHRFFGLIPIENADLRDVASWEHSAVMDAGEGVLLVGAAGETLLVPGIAGESGSICTRIASDLTPMLEDREDFHAVESRLYVFWGYLIAAFVLGFIGRHWDTFSKYNSLTPHGEPDASIFSAD